MKISILLPYKENFSPIYPGAVSLFVKDTVEISKYKKDIIVYGIQILKKNLTLDITIYHYQNLNFRVKVNHTLMNLLKLKKDIHLI